MLRNLVHIICTRKIHLGSGSNIMNRDYTADAMDMDTKDRLARRGSMDVASCAIRLRAARYVAKLESQDFAKEVVVTKAAVSNAEAALSFPSRDMMRYLYRAHRVDFNFLLNGDFVQLPGDVQDQLFPALERATREWDQKENSGPTPEKPKPVRKVKSPQT